MSDELSIDVGSAIPYAVERVLELVGKDQVSEGIRRKLTNQSRRALASASRVQCVGMSEPISIERIYQPTRFEREDDADSAEYTVDELTRTDGGAVVLARPGCGKTTFLNWLYCQLLSDNRYTPVMYPLRWPDAVQDLTEFVDLLKARKKVPGLQKNRIALLVDGYDEVTVQQRTAVSAALRDFQSLERGVFVLTCRKYFEIQDLLAPHYELAPFNRSDVLAFLRGFADAYGAEFDAEQLVDELQDRGLADLTSHPLMLALVAILKTGTNPALPKNGLGLIRRGIDTLGFRWDESKGVRRQSDIELDSYERQGCMSRVAFEMSQEVAHESRVVSVTRDYLRLVDRAEVNPRALLLEIAQWYGILIPVDEDEWTFSHRTIHDYLAAKYWVESGTFKPESLGDSSWSARAAYATCLLPDATEALARALGRSDSRYVLSECLANNAPFDPVAVAPAIHATYDRINNPGVKRDNGVYTVQFDDLWAMAGERLLTAVIRWATKRERIPTGGTYVILASALAEMQRRSVSLSPDLAALLLERFGGDVTHFQVERKGLTTIVDVRALAAEQ